MTQPPFFVYCPFNLPGNNPVNLILCLTFFKSQKSEIFFCVSKHGCNEYIVWEFPTREDRDKAWEYLRDFTDPARINQKATAHG